ncbi:MAG: tRNA 4-thiouridine(8) synthase ThiI [Clostridium sp.]|uniref:tRNA 4-thiouridine(8) synthase ThiI n=1 Tax=Clostridium sp. DSM 8431 TaxID=1761781 RepID=UPI0008E87EEF|nr:tRNA 4-thiouridine(8) synthase ThiI [Clostridium sp. DSM 8431]MCR4945248.1 tRNA 4-thiouridine(8) synthase ThiI [Clostridium sp.]SFU49911.1 Thiamine biosynthesis protein (ThiI) [Clostridium sp. DSM 8431]
MTRALAMISGGLDSTLAAKLVKDQGIEVIGVCFKSYFFGEESAKKMCEQIGVELVVVDFSREHFEMVKNPKHGRGKNMNPCIDCHAMMMNYAGKLLEEYNADFIITGEVLNQRPMSQNKQALNTVKKESGFADKILRPLCALNLEPTEMELSGLVDREKLMKISGRSRKVQMELADKWGIIDYPSPAGGCKLTEPNYSIRLKDALDRNGDLNDKEIAILRFGRHFITPSGTKIIVSRTADEGEEIKKIITKEDTVFLPYSHKGAMGIILGDASNEDKELAAKITARYTKGKDEECVAVKSGFYKTKFEDVFEVKPASEEEIAKYII